MKNSYAGFGCEFSLDWTYYTSDELQEVKNEADEIMDDVDLKSDSSMYDMAANDNDTQHINVFFNKLSVAERVECANVTEKQIISATVEKAEGCYEELENQIGMQIESIEMAEVTFFGGKALRGAYSRICRRGAMLSASNNG